MKIVHSEKLGDRGGVKVFIEILSSPGGKYMVRVIEKSKPINVPMDASGLPSEELAWDMFKLFRESYLRSQEEDPKSNFVAEEKLI